MTPSHSPQVTFREDMTVVLRDGMGGDDSVIEAMMVSTKGAESIDAEADYGRINFLMKNRHGTPFEHASLRFYIEAPIAVFREFHRHRAGWSYNEMSGRYKELQPVFYLPRMDRPLVQVGMPGHYRFEPGTEDQVVETRRELRATYSKSYVTYKRLLHQGVAKEVARMVLPVGIYSSMYATCNPRSLMHFLSLRTIEEGSRFPSYPQDEIEQVARLMEDEFAVMFPLTYRAFCENGRVAP